MTNRKATPKMYLDVVDKLRLLIKEEGITIGEKLPSERELAERLQVGRSSIREALRSLELLGLIETRRGEGTFLADFQKHQLVEVLAGFIMQQPNSVEDVHETRSVHELAAIYKICKEESLQQLSIWTSMLATVEVTNSLLREDVVRELIIATGNQLSLKIWCLLKQYSETQFNRVIQVEERPFVRKLCKSLAMGEEHNAVQSYKDWIDLIEGKRRKISNDS